MAEDQPEEVDVSAKEEVAIPDHPALVKIDSVEALQTLEAEAGDNLVFIAVVAFACPLSREMMGAIVNLVADNENKAKFALVEVGTEGGAAVAASFSISTLPYFFYRFQGAQVDAFSGDNVEKMKLMFKAATLKVGETLKEREKQRVEKEKAEAEAAAAAAAAAAAQQQ